MIFEVKNTTRPTYFVGTVHFMTQDQVDRSEPYKGLIMKAGKVMMELSDPGEELAMDIINNRDRWADEFPMATEQEAYRLLANIDRDDHREIAREMLASLPKVIALLSLSVMLSPNSAATSEEDDIELLPGLDDRIKAVADTLGIELEGLETPLQQFIMMRDHLSVGDLIEALNAPPAKSIDKAALGEAVLSGNVAEIERVINLMPGTKSEALVESRNLVWIDRIKAEANSFDPTPLVVAVGAGHLVGPTGLLAHFECSPVDPTAFAL